MCSTCDFPLNIQDCFFSAFSELFHINFFQLNGYRIILKYIEYSGRYINALRLHLCVRCIYVLQFSCCTRCKSHALSECYWVVNYVGYINFISKIDELALFPPRPCHPRPPVRPHHPFYCKFFSISLAVFPNKRVIRILC